LLNLEGPSAVVARTGFRRARDRHGPTSDNELWSASQAGDADAFGLLFERHARSIYNFCFRRTADWAVAEDLTSIVFLEAWRRRDKELPPDMVHAWLFGIATNVVRSRWRAQRRHRAALARMPRERPTPEFADESTARLDDEREMQRVLARVRGLPKRDRDVLALCVWSELSYAEAAVALGVPVGTVRSRLSRVKRRLRELGGSSGHVLGELNDDEGM
jgi:RNA polymerase sigma-70 factor (ECF subfamily)